jgi:hypothetical protein
MLTIHKHLLYYSLTILLTTATHLLDSTHLHHLDVDIRYRLRSIPLHPKAHIVTNSLNLTLNYSIIITNS